MEPTIALNADFCMTRWSPVNNLIIHRCKELISENYSYSSFQRNYDVFPEIPTNSIYTRNQD